MTAERTWTVETGEKWPFNLSIVEDGEVIAEFRRYAWSSAAKTVEDVLEGVGFKRGAERGGAVEGNRKHEEAVRLMASAPRLHATVSLLMEALEAVDGLTNKLALDLRDVMGITTDHTNQIHEVIAEALARGRGEGSLNDGR
jgi:hypothetical protein